MINYIIYLLAAIIGTENCRMQFFSGMEWPFVVLSGIGLIWSIAYNKPKWQLVFSMLGVLSRIDFILIPILTIFIDGIKQSKMRLIGAFIGLSIICINCYIISNHWLPSSLRTKILWVFGIDL